MVLRTNHAQNLIELTSPLDHRLVEFCEWRELVPILSTFSSPLCSPVAATTVSLACASPLTERALRSQRRDALRITHDAVPSPSSVQPPRMSSTASPARSLPYRFWISPHRLHRTCEPTPVPEPVGPLRYAPPRPYNRLSPSPSPAHLPTGRPSGPPHPSATS